MVTNFSKKLYTNMIKKREETEMKNSIWNLKNALTSTNPHTVKPYKASMCFGIFSFLIIVLRKQIPCYHGSVQ